MTPLKTFLVEDSPVIRENLIATLEEMAPVSVIGSAGDEAQAREWLATHREQCDLVIIDIFLRKGSGLGVLQWLGEQPQRCKRVVLSNFATPDIRRRCLGLGADGVFDKSAELEELLAFCAELVPDASAH